MQIANVHQGLLEKTLHHIFPGKHIQLIKKTKQLNSQHSNKLNILYIFDNYIITHVNARKVANLRHPKTDCYLELDIWLPTLNIGFEFQVCLIKLNYYY